MSTDVSPSRIPIPALELPRPSDAAANDFTSAAMPTNPNYVEGIPPDRGQAALRSLSDVESVSIPVALRANDIKGKEVIFYEITATSFSHVWTIYKRFSDFYEFHMVCKEQLCVEHDSFMRLPDVPSRLPTRTDSGIEARRQQLSEYMSQFLARSQEVERRIRMDAANDAGRNRAEGRLAALTHHTVNFLRNNSPLFLMVEQGHSDPLDMSAPTTQRAVAPASSTSPVKEGDDIPPVRITRYGDKAFVATLHVPGVATKDLYVVMNAEQPRHMIIGGRWNNYTAATSIGQTIESLVKGQAGEDAAAELERPEIYYDTLPVGDFEVTFEVPEPFVPAVWFSEMKDGVFHVVWSTVL